MRILVLEPPARDERAGSDERLDHGFVRLALRPLVGDNAQALEPGRLLSESSVLVHGVGNALIDALLGQASAVRHPQLEVFAAVAWSRVHETGSGLVGDVLALEQGDDEAIAVRMQGMGADHRGERIRIDVPQKFETGDFGGLERAFGQRSRENVGRADLRPGRVGRLAHAIAAIGDTARERDGPIAGNRPWRRGPDDNRSVVALDGERRVDRIARSVLVLDFRLGQRRLLDDAPHHRLRAAVEEAVGDELEDFARDLRLGGVAHRRVGMIPVPDDAEPLELLPLNAEPVLGVGAAFPPERDERVRIGEIRLGLALLAVEFLLNLPLDRQAVAVPTRHVVRVFAEHLL